MIWNIRNYEGIWFDNQNEIVKVFINDFSKRFTSENPRINHELFYSFSPCITEEENRELIKEVTKAEIRVALSHINNLKAPGPNGLISNKHNIQNSSSLHKGILGTRHHLLNSIG